MYRLIINFTYYNTLNVSHLFAYRLHKYILRCNNSLHSKRLFCGMLLCEGEFLSIARKDKALEQRVDTPSCILIPFYNSGGASGTRGPFIRIPTIELK